LSSRETGKRVRISYSFEEWLRSEGLRDWSKRFLPDVIYKSSIYTKIKEKNRA
jgi:hypothetical protein